MLKKATSVFLAVIMLQFMMLTVSTISYGDNTTYYVSVTGDDNNAGTIDQPFRTINKASQIMRAGNTCIIREGTYQETITPMNSGTENAPITYKSFPGENVTITGCDQITNWSVHSGNIYVANIDWDLGPKDNQVFANGEMMVQAQWPNKTSSNIFEPGHTSMTGGSATSITDERLNHNDDYWKDGIVWVMGRWDK